MYGDYMMQTYDEPLLNTILSYLVPENLRATLVAQGLSYDRNAQWYGTPYACRPFTQQQLTKYHTIVTDFPVRLPGKTHLFANN